MTSEFNGIYLGPDNLYFKQGNNYQITVTLVPATGEVEVIMPEKVTVLYNGLREFIEYWEAAGKTDPE